MRVGWIVALCAGLLSVLFAGGAFAAEKTLRLSHVTAQDSP